MNENIELLNLLIADEAENNPSLYSAGPIWRKRALKTAKAIKKMGLGNFRGLESGVGTGYTDNIVIDCRQELDFGIRQFAIWFTKLFSVNRIFEVQLIYTKVHYDNSLIYKQKFYCSSEKIKKLLSKYSLANSTEFGCVEKFTSDGQEFSFRYLNIVNTHEEITSFIDFDSISSFFEIGAGFGANIHILLENCPGIKKIIVLDIVPNLYVITNYLRHFYGESVIDYTKTRNLNSINFSDNNNLEILCIAPWQIEKLACTVDHFHNSASFEEMQPSSVQNYSMHIERILKTTGSISLVSSTVVRPHSSVDPTNLDKYFPKRKFESFEKPELVGDNFVKYYLSKNYERAGTS
jgi:putative sugar O-methyltransferase